MFQYIENWNDDDILLKTSLLKTVLTYSRILPTRATLLDWIRCNFTFAIYSSHDNEIFSLFKNELQKDLVPGSRWIRTHQPRVLDQSIYETNSKNSSCHWMFKYILCSFDNISFIFNTRKIPEKYILCKKVKNIKNFVLFLI